MLTPAISTPQSEWAEKGLRKEDYVLPSLHRIERRNAFGVYFIFRSMEQGRTFHITVPKFPTKDPNHRILAVQRSRRRRALQENFV
jgi:hypothetical protein